MTPEQVVRLATAVLPRDSRARWRDELLAELAALPHARRPAFARGVALHSLALRRALLSSPWHCRLHVFHRYRTATTDDGARYRRCTGCGKDDPDVATGTPDSLGWANVAQIY